MRCCGRILMGGGDPNNKVPKQNIKWEIWKLWEPIYWSQTPPVLHKYLRRFIFKPFFFVKLNGGILEHVVSLAKALSSTLAEKFSMCSVPLLPHCLRFLGMPRLSRRRFSICNFGFVPLCIVARCLGVVVVKWGIIATHTNWMEGHSLPQQDHIICTRTQPFGKICRNSFHIYWKLIFKIFSFNRSLPLWCAQKYKEGFEDVATEKKKKY